MEGRSISGKLEKIGQSWNHACWPQDMYCWGNLSTALGILGFKSMWRVLLSEDPWKEIHGLQCAPEDFEFSRTSRQIHVPWIT